MSREKKRTPVLGRDETLFTAQEVADILRITRTQVYYYVRSGQLRAIHLHRCIRFVPQDIRDYIREHKEPKEA